MKEKIQMVHFQRLCLSRLDISNIINIELNGLDNDGNFKTQKGGSANCPE